MSDEAEADGLRIERELGDAIAQVMSRSEGGFVLKWMALIETAGPSGERGLWTLTSDELKAWDTVGLLTHALQLQQAQLYAAIGEE